MVMILVEFNFSQGRSSDLSHLCQFCLQQPHWNNYIVNFCFCPEGDSSLTLSLCYVYAAKKDL